MNFGDALLVLGDEPAGPGKQGAWSTAVGKVGASRGRADLSESMMIKMFFKTPGTCGGHERRRTVTAGVARSIRKEHMEQRAPQRARTRCPETRAHAQAMGHRRDLNRLVMHRTKVRFTARHERTNERMNERTNE